MHSLLGRILFGTFLMTLSAIAAGLTLGILSLDLTRLRVISDSGSRFGATARERKEAQRAATLLPLRARGTELLITLLIVNVATNAAFSIFMGDSTSNITGFLVSTTLITVVGEIIPQAVCTHYSLQICSQFVPLIHFFKFVLFPVVRPMSTALDALLGQDLGAEYSRDQLCRLFMRHKAIFDDQEIRLIQGGLTMHTTSASDIMTPISKVFTVTRDEKVKDAFRRILASGYSRIPVVTCKAAPPFSLDLALNEDDQRRFPSTRVCAILFVKDLLLVDGIDDEIPMMSLVHLLYGGAYIDHVASDMPVLDLLKFFKQGSCHMAAVIGPSLNIEVNEPATPGSVSTLCPRSVEETTSIELTSRAPATEVIGIVTLEDVLENLLQDSITDEFDRHTPKEIHQTQTNERLPNERLPRRDKITNILLGAETPSPRDLSVLWPFLFSTIPELASKSCAYLQTNSTIVTLPKDSHLSANADQVTILLHGCAICEETGARLGTLGIVRGPCKLTTLADSNFSECVFVLDDFYGG